MTLEIALEVARLEWVAAETALRQASAAEWQALARYKRAEEAVEASRQPAEQVQPWEKETG